MAKKDNGKNVAIISYITIIGWVIALIMNQDKKKTELGSFHIRQTLLIFIIGILASWIPIVGWVVSILVFILWIIGLIGAIKGEKKLVPLIGPLAQDWFKGL